MWKRKRKKVEESSELPFLWASKSLLVAPDTSNDLDNDIPETHQYLAGNATTQRQMMA